MEITDILLESHIVTKGELTKKQLKQIEQLLKNPTEVNLEQIAKILVEGGHELIQKHAHSMQIGGYKSMKMNEESEDFLETIAELVNNFDDQSTQQSDTQKI